MRMKRKMIQMLVVGTVALSVPFVVSASDIGQNATTKASTDEQFRECIVNQKVSDGLKKDGTKSQRGTATIENQPTSVTLSEYGCRTGNHSAKEVSDNSGIFSDTSAETIVTQKITRWVCKNCGTQGRDIEAELSLVDKEST